MGRGAERKIVQNAIFRAKRHDIKILKVSVLLSRNFVVMARLLFSLFLTIWLTISIVCTCAAQLWSAYGCGEDVIAAAIGQSCSSASSAS